MGWVWALTEGWPGLIGSPDSPEYWQLYPHSHSESRLPTISLFCWWQNQGTGWLSNLLTDAQLTSGVGLSGSFVCLRGSGPCSTGSPWSLLPNSLIATLWKHPKCPALASVYRTSIAWAVTYLILTESSFFKMYLFLIGKQLLHNVVLVSVAH